MFRFLEFSEKRIGFMKIRSDEDKRSYLNLFYDNLEEESIGEYRLSISFGIG